MATVGRRRMTASPRPTRWTGQDPLESRAPRLTASPQRMAERKSSLAKNGGIAPINRRT